VDPVKMTANVLLAHLTELNQTVNVNPVSMKLPKVNHVLDVPKNVTNVLLVEPVPNVPLTDLEKIVNVTKDSLKNVDPLTKIPHHVTKNAQIQLVSNVPLSVSLVSENQTNVKDVKITETSKTVVDVKLVTLKPTTLTVHLVTKNVPPVKTMPKLVPNVKTEELTHQNVTAQRTLTLINLKITVRDVLTNVLPVNLSKSVLNVLTKPEIPQMLVNAKMDISMLKNQNVPNVPHNVPSVKERKTIV
jgi:hypothetical protein